MSITKFEWTIFGAKVCWFNAECCSLFLARLSPDENDLHFILVKCALSSCCWFFSYVCFALYCDEWYAKQVFLRRPNVKRKNGSDKTTYISCSRKQSSNNCNSNNAIINKKKTMNYEFKKCGDSDITSRQMPGTNTKCSSLLMFFSHSLTRPFPNLKTRKKNCSWAKHEQKKMNRASEKNYNNKFRTLLTHKSVFHWQMFALLSASLYFRTYIRASSIDKTLPRLISAHLFPIIYYVGDLAHDHPKIVSNSQSAPPTNFCEWHPILYPH